MVRIVNERKPANLTVLKGNPGNRPVPSGQSVSLTGVPDPPATLRGEAYAEWVRVTSFLSQVGKIEVVDKAALTVYCQAWGSFCRAAEELDEYGPLVEGREGNLVKNPAAQVMRDASDVMLKYGSKFGLTPRDRQAMGFAEGPSTKDELEWLIA